MRRVINAAIALACVVCFNLPLSVCASDYTEKHLEETNASRSYDPCDVNHDGLIDTSDVTLINKFLNGTKHVINYDQLDADRNLIVDYADSQFILSRVVGNTTYTANFIARTYAGQGSGTGYYVGGTITETPISFHYSSGGGVDGESSSTTSIEYCKYKYATGVTTYYMMPPVTMVTTNMQGDEPRSIVDGTDNRYSTTLPENSGLVHITAWDDNQPYVYCGTGFIVDDHKIATCAHNIYGKYDGDTTSHFFQHIEVKTYNQNGTLSSTVLNEIAVHIPNAYQSAYTRENDYAMITVEEELPATDYPHFAIGNCYNLSTSNYSYIPIYVTGCPGIVHGENNTSHRLYSQMGSLSSTNNTTATVLRYNVDATSGNSGSPVYTVIKNSNNKYYYTALGLHQGPNSNTNPTYNEGVRFNKYHKHFYMNNYIAELDF